jgi:hypothetical protein
MCTQTCTKSPASGAWVCPDADTGPSSDFTVTRCIDGGGDPWCVAECDFAKSASGCRAGYACVLRPRYGQTAKVFPVCLPAPGGWPGEPAPAFDIGEACETAADCGHWQCLALPGGYCTKTMCEQTGCPAGASCWAVDAGGGTVCLRDCANDTSCRTGEGYACSGDGYCWPDNAAPGWDPAVGGPGCAAVWPGGLSPCDVTPDDYVVVDKSARNLALCKKGSAVANFHVGLGFAPIGQKQLEGDGKTPEGTFYVASLVPGSSFYKAFLVSYPGSAAATWGLLQGLITPAEKDSIDAAQKNCKVPPQDTALGSYIEIHGNGGSVDWTVGCVAVEDFEIDQLWAVLGQGDTIVIEP